MRPADPMPDRPHRLAWLALTALGAALLLAGAATSVLAAGPPGCEVRVEPKIGEAGTEFILSGAGYTPTLLTLHKNNGRQTAVELDLDGADPFEIPIGSRPGDEGLWTATVSVEAGECTATVTFRVTLLDTATGDAIRRGSGLPLGLYVLVGLLGFGGGTLIARRVRLA